MKYEKDSSQRKPNYKGSSAIRTIYPKGYDFDEVTDKYIEQIENTLNNRTRKMLDYFTLKSRFRERNRACSNF